MRRAWGELWCSGAELSFRQVPSAEVKSPSRMWGFPAAHPCGWGVPALRGLGGRPWSEKGRREEGESSLS